ncbi:short-chain dehydrogenase [Pseudomonas fluorescens]|uniref:Short-chain dehydrogenase n=1 Tax=Pseudomonas fluorescens TaxID=294 RepID=A0A327N770_PSEFL|nr:short-chain dehydrogenase/reductase [Pseudomonas fluorescens]RAI70852.1 short-chain dehydrogenase [Pseudomonas fluorescens]
MYSLHDKVVLITGAGGGIGAASARALHGAGAKVVLLDVTETAVRELAAELGPRAVAMGASVTSREDMDRAVELAVDTFGGIDVVFANAGIACDPPSTIRNMDEATFERIVEVDLLGVWRTVRACLPQICARNGHVLITSSVYAFVNGVVNAPYAMSKAGVEMFGRSLRAELAGTGATAGVLYPGWVATAIAKSAFGGHAAATELAQLAYPGILRKAIQPERIAEAVVKGIECRSARVNCPRRWIPLSMFRGLFNLLTDWTLDHDKRIQRLIRKMDIPSPISNPTE